jgi:hypothetical protein
MNGRWILVLGLSSVASAQMQCEGVLYGLKDFTVLFKTLTDREGPGKQPCGDTTAAGNLVKRVLYDTSGKPYFGYQIRITPAGDRQYRAEMGPLTDLHLLSFSKFPQPVVVRAEEYVDIPVLERRASSVADGNFLEYFLDYLGLSAPLSEPSGRVTDYFQIVSKGMPWAGIPIRSWAETPPSGTFLTLDRPHLSTNALGEVGMNNQMGVIGPVVWFYREGLGRFLFSASERPGFRRTAVVEGAVLRFSDEPGAPTVGQYTLGEYTVGLHSNAVRTPGTWMIWMKHEREFRPSVGLWTKQDLKGGVLALGVEK